MEWKKIFYANGKGKKAGVAVLISNKIDSKTKAKVRDKEGHYTITKGTTQQGYSPTNINAPGIAAPKYVNQILMEIKGETDTKQL